ncbi:uncharacterized protein LOC109839334 [Asparagus officinalis]|uniref:uncharacterized protein LOC109839334 n=1 Tax=Asparagus officinalis TaxID=4686 RepID=UPI00098E5D50|nr:uncharacterized protein LOC109839334 [Asparagus officinalis]
MAACSFDHTFLYVAAGWEGSASDMSVLRATLEDGKFNVPEACCVLHNFIARHQGNDKYFNMLNGLEMNEDEDEVEEEEDPQYMVGADESLRGEQLRNRIALQLWNN